ncbi:MAG: aminopeptidase [Chloroflexota bacterium]
MSDFEQNLKKYANLLVHVGSAIQPGMRLMVQPSLTDDPTIRRLVHYIVEAAYKAGSPFVKVRWRDQMLQKIRLENAPDESFDMTDEFYFHTRKTITEEGGSMMFLLGDDPDLLAGQDQDKIARMSKASGNLFRPISLLNDQGYGTWTIGAIATKPWADKMLADLPEGERVSKLWELIFKTCRIDQDDPVVAWQDHASKLQAIAQYLNEKQYTALRYQADGTDLTVGMPQDHVWAGGGDINNKDIEYMPNIPTEEVFSMPHREKINGTVKATKPLSYAGTLIDDFSVTFKDGRIVDFTAKTGAETFQRLIDQDEGARYIGEVALAPSTSPIAQTGRIFYETLFDENASNHLAIGNAYRTCLKDGAHMEEDRFVELGGNVSITHVDFMIGSTDMTVDGIRADGTAEPIMRDGTWAFDVE